MRSHFLLLMALALASTLSHGDTSDRKTDVVTLYNGDRVTGELKTLFSGHLEIHTSSMGILQVEWQDIARIQSKHRYEVRLTEGTRYYGKIVASERPGELIVSATDSQHEIATLAVAEIRPVAQSFKDRIDVYLSLGYSYTKASSLGQTSFNTDISYEDEKTRNSLKGRLIITDTNREVTRSSKVDLTRSVWTNRQDTYRIIMGSYETNDELAVDYRLSAGAGLGRHFSESPGSYWNGALGLQVLTEKSTLGDTQESVEGIVSTEYSTWKYDTPELNLKFNLSIFPSITESGRVRADTGINLRWEIIRDLYWDVTAFGTYDNKSADDSRFDYGLSTGVGWEY